MTGVSPPGLGVIRGAAWTAVAAAKRRIGLLEAPACVPLASPARLALAVAVSSIGLAACSTTASDVFKRKPETTLLLIESNPAGAQAKTSLGQSCRTPCTMLIGSGSDFTVTFTLDGYVPQTLTVHATMSAGGWTTAPSPVLDPGSLFPTLEPVKQPPTGARRARTASRPAAAGEGTQQ